MSPSAAALRECHAMLPAEGGVYVWYSGEHGLPIPHVFFFFFAADLVLYIVPPVVVVVLIIIIVIIVVVYRFGHRVLIVILYMSCIKQRTIPWENVD